MSVTVMPSGCVFDVRPDETIIRAAWRNGYFWPTICNGDGTCKACVFRVEDGEEHLSAVESWEQEGLTSLGHPPNAGTGWRLACQTRASGDIRVRKAGVRKAPEGTVLGKPGPTQIQSSSGS
jgi:ferredoxin, 2Fe-2S